MAKSRDISDVYNKYLQDITSEVIKSSSSHKLYDQIIEFIDIIGDHFVLNSSEPEMHRAIVKFPISFGNNKNIETICYIDQNISMNYRNSGPELRYKLLKDGQKPAFIIRSKIISGYDDQETNSLKSNPRRYIDLFRAELSKVIDKKYFCYFDILDTFEIRIVIVDQNFKFEDIFQPKNASKFIKKHPDLFMDMAEFIDSKELYDYIKTNSMEIMLDNLTPQANLNYTKRDKEINDPERFRMEEENDMFAFVASPTFKENGDTGNYKKDIYIERMVKIDPYNVDDGNIVSMMKLISVTQGNDHKLYCIWLPKDAFSEEDLDNINDDSMTFLRESINRVKQVLA